MIFFKKHFPLDTDCPATINAKATEKSTWGILLKPDLTIDFFYYYYFIYISITNILLLYMKEVGCL